MTARPVAISRGAGKSVSDGLCTLRTHVQSRVSLGPSTTSGDVCPSEPGAPFGQSGTTVPGTTVVARVSAVVMCRPPSPGSLRRQMRAPVQLADILAEDADARTRAALERAGYRAVLSVPLLRESAVVGALVVRRTTPGAFDAGMVAWKGRVEASRWLARLYPSW